MKGVFSGIDKLISLGALVSVCALVFGALIVIAEPERYPSWGPGRDQSLLAVAAIVGLVVAVKVCENNRAMLLVLVLLALAGLYLLGTNSGYMPAH
jgi:hypothetical protein